MSEHDADELIPAGVVLQEMNRQGERVPYIPFWRALFEGAAPGEQINGRWHIRRGNVGIVVETMRERMRPKRSKPSSDQRYAIRPASTHRPTRQALEAAEAMRG